MANTFTYVDKKFSVGDTISVSYKIKEGEGFRVQPFKGILIKVRGSSLANRMITVRKISRSGLGIERIFPITSPAISGIALIKKTNNQKAKLYYLRNLSEQEVKTKLYQSKTK